MRATLFSFAVGFIILNFCWPYTCQADEGFYPIVSKKVLIPKAVSQVEKITVALWRSETSLQRPSLSTAFLVKIKSNGKKTTGLFITNAHVFKQCGTVECNYHLYHHYSLLMNHTVPQDSEAWTAEIKKIISIDKDKDLACFTVDLAKNVAMDLAEDPSLLPVLHQWSYNDQRQVFAIGTPDVTLRAKWHVTSPVTDPQMVWSSGRAIGVNEVNFHKILFHSADLLPGNSGGPLFDSEGRIVGINTRANKGINGSFEYDDSAYNEAVPVDSIISFIENLNF